MAFTNCRKEMNKLTDFPKSKRDLTLPYGLYEQVISKSLGLGLAATDKLSEGKDCLTVLDFIGQANKKYSFESKFAALLSNTSRSVVREIKDGFTALPKGCYIQLERKAAK